MRLNFRSVSQLPSVYFDGHYRVLGFIPPNEEDRAGFRKFSDFHAITPVELQEIDLSKDYKLTTLDQGSTSACVAFSSSGGIALNWMQMGKDAKVFNPFFLYGLINGGQDKGAMVSDAMRALMSVGVCSREALPDGLMFKQQFPQSAFDDAANYKLLQALRCDTYEEICSAISRGLCSPFGILVGSNFASLDAEGVAPLPDGRGGGHALLGVGLKKSARYGWIIKFLNSWGGNYGVDHGYGYLHKEHFQYMNPDAFAIQSMSDPNSDVPVVKGN